MALTRDQKEAQVTLLTQKMQDSASVVFAHYIGLNVSEVDDLRGQLLENGAEMKVAKKRLMGIAATEAGLPELDEDSLDGPVACIFSFEDPLSGAQVAFKFAKKHKQVALIGGVFDGKLLTKEEAVELAKMPSREELLAKFVGMIQSPLTSFAGICSSPLSGFARALKELGEKGGVAPVEAEPETAKEEVKKEPAAEEKEEAPTEESTEPTSEEASGDSADAAEEAKFDSTETAS